MGKLILNIYPDLAKKENDKIFLMNSYINGNLVSLDKASIESLDELFKKLRGIVKNSKLEKQMEEYNEMFETFSRLKSFRNNNIISHQLKGYTKEEILQKLDMTENKMFEKFIEHYEKICSRKFINFFDEKNKELLQLIK